MIEYDVAVAWLNQHGKVTAPAYITNSGQYCVTWQAHDGFMISAYGKTEVALYINLYNNIKDDLFEWCMVLEAT